MKRFVHAYGQMVMRLESLALNACSLLVVTMCVTLLAEVAARSLFGASFIWSIELATVCFIWLAFLGSTVGVLRQEHFTVDLLYRWFPPEHWFSAWLDALTYVLIAVLGTVFVVYGIGFMENGMRRHSFSLGIPQGYVMAIMPLCGALFIINSVHHLLRMATGQRTFS